MRSSFSHSDGMPALPKKAAALRPAILTTRSCSCLLSPATGSMTRTTLFLREKVENSAPGPDMSMTPSWKLTIFPVVTTHTPSRETVMPSPATWGSEKMPGKGLSSSESLARGSMTSFTGTMRTLSPGAAIRISTLFICRSSSRTSVRVAASMVRQPFFTSVYFPKATLWTLTFLKMNSFMAGSSFIGVFRALQVLE
ncbi:MAG: hypothetical protein BWY01_00423 [Synergistetes bacterium ADurb.Bin155]|nr:MAG: hypothetical protein BWY01_00423 [Synergistetes bacterium ADurb.Bin155]